MFFCRLLELFFMQRHPTSPGKILFEEFLLPLGITQKRFADHLGYGYKVINQIINESASISPKIAIKLAAALNTTPAFWLNAQKITCKISVQT